jgi:hypothetical protein
VAAASAVCNQFATPNERHGPSQAVIRVGECAARAHLT